MTRLRPGKAGGQINQVEAHGGGGDDVIDVTACWPRPRCLGSALNAQALLVLRGRQPSCHRPIWLCAAVLPNRGDWI